jgi:LuxR family maltose regulon positive regulatory protein
MNSNLELRLLGPVELLRGGTLVDAAAWRRRRVRLLLIYLVLHRTASRTRIADAFWPALDAEAQSRNLRVTLTHLRRVLEPGRARRAPSFFLRDHGGNIVVHPGDRLRVDLWDLDRLCERAAAAERRGAIRELVNAAQRAAEQWRGDPEDAACEPWAFEQIEQHRVRLAAIAIRAAELLLTHDHVDPARTLAERVLAIDPWHEPAYRLLMTAHRRSGDELAAHRCLQQYRTSMGELGLDPERTRHMERRLLETIPDHGSTP